MKRLLRSAVIFLSLLFIADFVVGKTMSWLQSKATGGHTARHIYINTELVDSVIVFGSSRAVHHYNTSIITDALGVSTYNCGTGGNGILLAYMQLNKILERTTPQLVIYDLMPDFDVMKGQDNVKYLFRERPFYGTNKAVDSLFWRIDATERLKMLSKSYQFNSQLAQFVSDWIHPRQTYDRGFKFLSGEIPANFVKPAETNADMEIDSLKLEYFERFVKLCKDRDIELLFVMSPYFYNSDKSIFRPQHDIAADYGIEVIDFYTHPDFVGHREYFVDSSHLNNVGADEFTRRLIPHLKRLYAKKDSV